MDMRDDIHRHARKITYSRDKPAPTIGSARKPRTGRDRADDGVAPIVSDPDRRCAAKVVAQRDHVSDDLADCVTPEPKSPIALSAQDRRGPKIFPRDRTRFTADAQSHPDITHLE
jgi:hypothetical protein